MSNTTKEEDAGRLLTSLAAQEPFVTELGTPQLVETGDLDRLVGLGREIVPYLIGELMSESPRRIAYVAAALGRLDDPRAIEPLRELSLRYQSLDTKSEWEYAVIGQCNAALDALTQT